MKRMLFASLLPLLLASGFSAQAGNLASLAIIDQQTGEPMKIWRHAGHNYVVGQPGQRYALQISNKTPARLLAVVAVDGINVISGATASPKQSGYVLSGWQQQDVAGWRKSMQDVAAFYFTELSDSYAARTGRANQAGVIGVALYREQPEPRSHIERYDGDRPVAPPSIPAPGISDSRRDKAEASADGKTDAPLSAKGHESSAAKSAKRAAPGYVPEAEPKLGTGHGERIESSSRMTDFKRATSNPSEVLTVYYDSYANLVARGVIPTRYRPTPARPNPFPGSFVPDPS